MKRPNCNYPQYAPITAYTKGCRCDECLESKSAVHRRYYERNREKMLERKRRYYERNREKMLEYKRRYYQANSERVLEQQRKYREENPAIHYLSNIKCEVKRKCPKAIIELSQHENEQMENLVEELIRRKKESSDNCSACNGEGCPDCILTIDHIKPLSKGGLHHPDNLQILTLRENSAKHDSWDGISGC